MAIVGDKRQDLCVVCTFARFLRGPRGLKSCWRLFFIFFIAFQRWNYICTNCYTTWTKIFGILTLREFCWGQMFETYKLPMPKISPKVQRSKVLALKKNGGQPSMLEMGLPSCCPPGDIRNKAGLGDGMCHWKWLTLDQKKLSLMEPSCTGLFAKFIPVKEISFILGSRFFSMSLRSYWYGPRFFPNFSGQETPFLEDGPPLRIRG